MNAATLPSLPPLTPARRSSGHRTLLLIVGLLAMPFVIATLLWFFGWQPGRQINHGELLASADRPALLLREGDLQKISANAALHLPEGQSAMLGHWTLALVVPVECDQACVDQLQLARQVQVSLNKDMARLKRALIGPQLHDAAALAVTQQRWPDLRIARANPAGWQTLRSADTAPHLVLIDPQGQLVLRYGATPDPKGLRRDVERLLKFSWLG